MIPYLIRVAVKSVVTLFAIATITFIATRLSGNPIDTVRGDGLTDAGRAELIRYFQLDGSLWQQYLAFMRGAVSGEFGLSFVDRRPVTEVVGDRLWASGQLLLASVAFTLLVAIPLVVPWNMISVIWLGFINTDYGFLGQMFRQSVGILTISSQRYTRGC